MVIRFTEHFACAKLAPIMRYSTDTTPLLDLLRALETDDRRDELARGAGTTRVYLYSLATCQRCSCRAPLAKGIADASAKLAEKYGTPVVTMEQLATMCAGAA
ncbi:MAG: hypothetical protein RL684_701 [Pseudomonadota bacterium]